MRSPFVIMPRRPLGLWFVVSLALACLILGAMLGAAIFQPGV